MFNDNVTYFPYLTMPENSDLIKASLLYWDNIYLLAHNAFNTHSRDGSLGDTTRLLMSEGLLRASYIDKSVPGFEKELDQFQPCNEYLVCYASKFPEELTEKLISKGFAKRKKDHHLVDVDKGVAFSYLYHAAKTTTLANKTDLLTDRDENFKFVLNQPVLFDEEKVNRSMDKSRRLISVLMKNVFVIPGQDYSYQDVLNFKNENKDKYHTFRREMSTSFSMVRDSISDMSDKEILELLKRIREMTDDCLNVHLENKFRKFIKNSLNFAQFIPKIDVGAKVGKAVVELVGDEKAINPCFTYCALANKKFG